MKTETSSRRAVARQSPPDVFENFVGVEELGMVEQIEASLQILVVKRDGHKG